MILAAGKGARMNTELPKAMLPINGQPMLKIIVDKVNELAIEPIIVIVGHKKEVIIDYFSKSSDALSFVTQAKQLGSADALLAAKDQLKDFNGAIVVLSADVPLITISTLQEFIADFQSKNNILSLITATVDDPASYGRIIRDRAGNIKGNVEAKEATSSQLLIDEINSGIYIFDSNFLFETIEEIDNDNRQNEYYLTDLINIAIDKGEKVGSFKISNSNEILGANNQLELAKLDRLSKSTN